MNNNTDKNSTGFQDEPGLIVIRTKLISIIMEVMVILLAIVSITGQYLKYYTEYDEAFGLIPLFNMDKELSIPSMFSVLILFFAALLLLVITILKKKCNDSHICGWAILAFGFMYLTFDEGATIHEKLMQPMHRLLGENFPSAFYFPWVIPAIIGVAIVGLCYTKFIVDLPKETKRSFLLSAIIYVGGAVGVEMISGVFAGKNGLDNFGFNIVATIEEVLEMTGIILFIQSLLIYLGKNYEEIRFKINSQSNSKRASRK